MASCGLTLDRCSTWLPEFSGLPFGIVAVAQKTMAQWLRFLKITQLTPDAKGVACEVPMSAVRLTLASPMYSESFTAADVRQAMEDKGMLSVVGVKVALFFKDDDGDFVALPNQEEVWPASCISDGVLKAWFTPAPQPTRAPEPLATTPSKPLPRCLGPHVHQPPKRKLHSIDFEEFRGYSLLAAAEDGCVPCVEYWLDNQANVNFESGTNRYTALDFVRWSAKRSRISSASAREVEDVLVDAGGRANKV